jgi:hypothetical protein
MRLVPGNIAIMTVDAIQADAGPARRLTIQDTPPRDTLLTQMNDAIAEAAMPARERAFLEEAAAMVADGEAVVTPRMLACLQRRIRDRPSGSVLP